MAHATPSPLARLHAAVAHGLEWVWPAGAAWAYGDAVVCSPDVPELHFLHGRALGRIGRWHEAARSLRRAAQLDPTSVEFLGALAIALDRVGQQGALVDALNRFAQLRPGEGEVHLLIGAVLRRAGRKVEALRAFRRAVGFAPAPGLRRFLLAESLLGERDWERALTDSDEARRIDPTRAAAEGPGRSPLNFHPGRPLAPRPRREPAPRGLRAALRRLRAALLELRDRSRGLVGRIADALVRVQRVRAIRRAWRSAHARRAVRWGSWRGLLAHVGEAIPFNLGPQEEGTRPSQKRRKLPEEVVVGRRRQRPVDSGLRSI